MCWTSRIGSGKVRVQRPQKLHQRLRPSGRRDDAHHRVALAGGAEGDRGRPRGAERQAAVALPHHLDLAHDGELGGEAGSHRLEGGVADPHRLLHHRQRAGPQRVHGDAQFVVVDVGRNHHDRGGAAVHHRQGEVEPVHSRQADVQRDDVGGDDVEQGQPLLGALHCRHHRYA